MLVEAGAGARARFSDQSFAEAGAQLVDDAAALYRDADILLKVRRPLAAGEGQIDEMALLRPGQVLVGMLDPYQHPEQVAAYAKAGVIAFALELLPRTTRAQAMDVLSSQANLAGYRAMIDGLAEFDRVMPMLMTAAGTVPPAKVFVIGAGVAGLQAIATARRLGAVVSATDIRPAAKEEIESLGAKFVGVVKAGRGDRGRLRQGAVRGGQEAAGRHGRPASEEPGPRDHHGADPRPAGAAPGRAAPWSRACGRARWWWISRSKAAATWRAARSARWST